MTEDAEMGASKYDMRDMERRTFGQMYRNMIQAQTKTVASPDDDNITALAANLKTISQYLRHYATSEEMHNLAKQAEAAAEKELKRLRKSASTCDPERLYDARDKVERVRMDVGLKLPQETEVDEESVMVDNY